MQINEISLLDVTKAYSQKFIKEAHAEGTRRVRDELRQLNENNPDYGIDPFHVDIYV